MRTKKITSVIFLLLVSISLSIKANFPGSKNIDGQLELSIAHLYGYARYFNPNKSLEKFNWDKFLMHTLRQAESIPNNDASIRLFLESTFRPLIPDMKLTKDEQLTHRFIVGKTNQNKGFAFEHYGFGTQKRFSGKEVFHSKIIYTEHDSCMPKIDSLYTYQILDNLYLHYPISISKQNNSFNKELRYLRKAIDTIDIRITEYPLLKIAIKKDYGYSPLENQDNSFFKANLISQWAIMKHFYPYRIEDGMTNSKMYKLTVSCSLIKLITLKYR